MTPKLVRIFCLFGLLLVAKFIWAQGPPPPPPAPCATPPCDLPVPLDGGISLLIAAGIGYGAKKLHDHRKKS